MIWHIIPDDDLKPVLKKDEVVKNIVLDLSSKYKLQKI